MNLGDLKTGDLLLFNHKAEWSFMGILTSLIKFGTHSDYSHIAMVLRDPTWLDPALKGLYVWESSFNGTPDPQDGKVKLGVQVTPLAELMAAYPQHIYVRRPTWPSSTATPFTPSTLRTIHRVVYDKPYDLVPKDWVDALLRKDPDPQVVSRFWCSALVGYIYTITGILAPTTDWTILRPSDFSLDGQSLVFQGGFGLEAAEYLLETK